MSAAAGDVSWPPLPAHARTGGRPADEDEAAERVLTRALGWLEAHLEWFAPPRWERFLPRRPFRPGPLLELVGLVRVLEQTGVLPRHAPLSARALDLAAQVAAGADFGHGLARGDEFFPYHLNLVALLDLLGRPQPALRAACQELLAADAGGHARPYKPVVNRIELRYFIDRGGFTAPASLPDARTLHGQSIAALGPDLLQLTESETYALTHVLFYMTDFGRHRRLPGGTAEAARLRETVQVLLGVHLSRGSLDLLAELLLCATALDDGHGTGPTARQGWNALARAQRPDGAVPSPVHRPEVMSGLSGEKAAAYLFGTCYHTTTVAVLAAAVRRRSLRLLPRPQDRRPEPPLPPLPCADPEEIRSWTRKAPEALRTAPPGGRAVWSSYLAPLLVLGVQARDPAVLADVTRAADRLGHGDHPLLRAAAALCCARSRRPPG
ncbi:hypothetical protein GCM10010466_31130 [Planomonospora alba]|uniref:DUF6895 domain-containing protein n=1 Tax=Planomonospora alba TaxID=161354 RepID=R4ZCJ7_9ACTN|nr:hypothetical protein [Planomonospora alba]